MAPSNPQLSIAFAGKHALTLYLPQPTQPYYPAFWQMLSSVLKEQYPQLLETVPAYCSLMLVFKDSYDHKPLLNIAQALLSTYLGKPLDTGEQGLLRIPVCYHPEFALDLEDLSQRLCLSRREIIAHHSAKTYLVYAIGFIPGFAFLGYVDDRIASPRHQTPRPQVPAGSVGIAGKQTGIYPADSPGGWQIIGRSPMCLYDPSIELYSRFGFATRVHFYEITMAEYHQWQDPIFSKIKQEKSS